MKIQPIIKNKLPSLNGLRGISIILVVIHHLVLQYNIFQKTNFTGPLHLFIRFIQNGHLGVSIFLVISGFLITYLLLKEEQETQTISLKKFYLRRSLRIFPAYYFLLFTYSIAQSLGYLYISKESWLTAITYTKYFNWYLDWYTSHLWSLSVEEQFYLLWPFVFLLGNTTRKSLAIFLVLMVLLLRLYDYYFPTVLLNELTLFFRIDAIACGCLLALYKDDILSSIPPLYLKVLFYISLAVLFCFPWTDQSDGFIIQIGTLNIPLTVMHATLEIFCITVITLYSLYLSNGLWFKLLNTKALEFIGVLSYSIYLWQQLFIKNSGYTINSLPINLILLSVFALGSYYLIEKPFLKLKANYKY